MKINRWLLVVVLIGLTIAGGLTASAGEKPERIKLAMTYIPNVQFAPWYVAQEKGFFRQEGLEVEMDYRMDIDALQLVAQGELDFAIAGGDQVIIGRARGIPVRYLAGLYAKFPAAVISLKDKKIRQPQDLKGKTIGLPLYGTSLLAIRAIMAEANLKESDVRLVDIGYTQIPSLTEGKVDAVVGFANNEPIQLKAKGFRLNVINGWDYFRLVGHGLVTGDDQIKRKPEQARAMVRATVRGMRYAIDHPDEAFTICRRYIPSLSKDQVKVQQEVLKASIKLWQNEYTKKHGLGSSDPEAWGSSQEFMVREKLAPRQTPVSLLMTNEFLK